MLAFRSSLARLMLATATVGVGLAAARSQADFWLGALATLAAGWVLLALGEAVAAPGWGRRVPWLAALVGLGAGLVYGFGPWSDAGTRGSRPVVAYHLSGYDRQLLRTSAVLIRLADRLELGGRAEVYLFRWGEPVASVVLIEATGSRGPARELMAQLQSPGPSVAFFESWRVFFDSCYLLGSLALGATVGLVVALMARARGGDRPPRSILDDRAGGSTIPVRGIVCNPRRVGSALDQELLIQFLAHE